MRTFICVVLAVVAISIGAALFTGIMSGSAERTDGKFVASVRVDTHPFQRTLNRIDSTREETSEPDGTETAMGMVSEYDEGAQSFVLSTSDNRELMMHVDSLARITGRRLAGLQLGDRVTVVYTTYNGEHTASSVTVE